MKPYDWQRRDLDTMRDAGYRALLNCDMGSGKTPMAVWAAQESGARVVLIVAPLATHQTAWKPTVREIVGAEVRTIGNGKKADREAMTDFELGTPGWYVVTPQLVARSEISGWSGDFLIWDEFHQGCTPGVKTQRAMSGFTPREGDASLSRRFPRRLALSGTPARQAFQNLWGVARFLFPELYLRGEAAADNFYGWEADRMNYTEVYTNQRNQDGTPKKVKQYYGEKHPGQFMSELPCVITHKRRETCCSAHPGGFLKMDEPQVIDRVVELHKDQKKAIRELEEHMMTWLDENPLITEIPLVTQMRVRQICLGVPTITYSMDGDVEKATLDFAEDCASPFTDEIFEILTELPADETVLILMDSQRFAEVLTKRLNKAGITAAEYSGKTVKDRQQYLDDFGVKYRVLVGVTASIGTGVDGLQHKCSTEIWAEQPVSITNRQQAEGRLERTGQTKQIQRFRLIDSEGYATGRIEDSLQKQLLINQSLRRVVA